MYLEYVRSNALVKISPSTHLNLCRHPLYESYLYDCEVQHQCDYEVEYADVDILLRNTVLFTYFLEMWISLDFS
jgi:hypothetical protein